MIFAVASDTGFLYRSSDGGATWTSLTAFPQLGPVFSAANPNVGYIAGASWVSRTSDAGLTFPTMRGLTVCCVVGIAADPNVESTAYISMSSGAIYKTLDAGASWNPVSGNTFLLNPPDSLTVARTNPTTIYVRTSPNQNGFAAKISPDGKSLAYSTFLSGGGSS